MEAKDNTTEIEQSHSTARENSTAFSHPQSTYAASAFSQNQGHKTQVSEQASNTHTSSTHIPGNQSHAQNHDSQITHQQTPQPNQTSQITTNQVTSQPNNQANNHQTNQHRPPSQPTTYSSSVANTKDTTREKIFIPLLLLISAAVIALIIGVGWALFYPRQPRLTDSQKNRISTELNKNEQARTPDQVPNNTLTQTLSIPEGTIGINSEETEIVYGKIKQDPTRINQVGTKDTSTSQTSTTQNDRTRQQNNQTESIQQDNRATTKNAPVTADADRTSSTESTYWIQVFSSTNKDRATVLSGTLKSEGVSTNIVAKEINRVLYYRVRVGPFYNKKEGDKFKEWFVSTGKFDDAFLVEDRN